MATRARCGGRNVCLAANLPARLSLRRLTHPQISVTIDGYTNLISLLSFLILMIRVLVKLSVLPECSATKYQDISADLAFEFGNLLVSLCAADDAGVMPRVRLFRGQGI
jgi:hypothetical protein